MVPSPDRHLLLDLIHPSLVGNVLDPNEKALSGSARISLSRLSIVLLVTQGYPS